MVCLTITFLAVISMASAHNWIEGSRGRSQLIVANQFCSPVPPQVNRQRVHMQVAQEQNFVVEWAAAHGDSTYFIIIHDDARENVSLLTHSLMDDWLAGCPDGGLANNTNLGRKYHRFRPNKNLTANFPVNDASPTISKYWEVFHPDPIFSGSVWDAFSMNGGRPQSFFFPSPPNLNCSYGKDAGHLVGYDCFAPGPQTMLAKYLDSELYKDRRCSYTNPTNPWIHTIHRYTHHDVADGYATALMQIPVTPKGPGRYQLHYKWSSYCDTMDVDVKPQGQTVANPYGVVDTSIDNVKYDIAHHCLFPNPRRVGQCLEVVRSVQQCEAICSSNVECRGFQVLPLQLDNSQGESFGLFPEKSYIPWTNNTIDPYLSFCFPDQFVAAGKSGSMICYPIITFQDDFNSARPLWSFTADTNHQAFYGTCYLKPSLRKFGDTLGVQDDQVKEYRFLSTCVPCDNIGQDLTNPRWGPQQKFCTDCDKFPAVTPRKLPVPPTWTRVAQGTFNESAHWLSPAGSPFAFEDECKILAQRDPSCSKYVMYSDYRTKRNAGQIPGVQTTDVKIDNTNIVLVTERFGNYRYVPSTAYNNYFRTCACLDKAVVSNFTAGQQPIIDPTMSALACHGLDPSACVFRNFSIFKLS